MTEPGEKNPYHLCTALPDVRHSGAHITRCMACGQYWKRKFKTGDGFRWAPMFGLTAWRLRRQMRVRGQR
ncbi:hypothetical protein [Streptomyces mirabilis]|uniref:hypothetical protein n=1 Tax=Streptomyces mirabilis TaxID=68239 RepID=UPI00368B7374